MQTAQQQQNDELELPQLPKTRRELYDLWKEKDPAGLAEHQAKMHLTEEMMCDESFTLGKYLQHLVENNLTIPKEQMEKLLQAIELEKQAKESNLQNGTQWANKFNPTSQAGGEDTKWVDKFEARASLDSDKAKIICVNFASNLKVYNQNKASWADQNSVKEQLKAISTALSLEVDIDKMLTNEPALVATIKSGVKGFIAREILGKMIGYAKDPSKAAKEVAKQGSDDIARSAMEGAKQNIDDVAEAGGEFVAQTAASSADDVARGVVGAAGGETFQHAIGSVASGVVAFGGFLWDQKIQNDYHEKINTAL